MTQSLARDTNKMELVFAEARSHFPGACEQVYMDVAGRGLLSLESRRAIHDYLEMRTHEGGDKLAMFALIERVREQFAALCGAAPEEIAFTGSVSEGINTIANSLPWRQGDSVVLCVDIEHPNNIYPWRNLEMREGIEIRNVPARDGAIDVDAMAAAIDGSTRVMSVSAVSFAPGFRTDLRALGRICRERGVFSLIDAAQSIGVLHTDVDDLMIDAFSVSTQKGLLGLYSMGFLYCRKSIAERISPAYLARFGVDAGGRHESAMGGAEVVFMPGARRFEVGHPNFLGAAALEPSLHLLSEIGTVEIDAWVTELAAELAAGFLALGLPVCGGPPGPHLGNIVSVGQLAEGLHDTTDDKVIGALFQYLIEHGVKMSIRKGVLRFSLHLFNSPADVERVLDLTKQFLNSRHGRNGRGH